MNTMRKSVIGGMLALVMVFALVFGAIFTVSAINAGDKTAYALHDEVLDYKYADFAHVTVNNDEEFRLELQRDRAAFITVGANISVETFEKINIEVKGNKILDLNGKELYYSSKAQFIDGTTEYRSNAEGYDQTLLTLGDGVTLSIIDSSGGKGCLQFDSKFGDFSDEPYDIVRNVIEVKKNATLNVYGGQIISGRTKKQFLRAADWTGDSPIMASARMNCYHMGSAVLITGGTANIAGGTLVGRGFMHAAVTFDWVYANGGKLYVEDGTLVGYGRASAINIKTHEDNLNKVEIKIMGGTFRSYCEEYALQVIKGQYPVLSLYAPRAVVIERNYTKYDCEELRLADYYAFEDGTRTIVETDNYSGRTGMDVDDWNEHMIKISPKDTQIGVIKNEAGDAQAATIYQNQALTLTLDYADQALWPMYSRFYNTSLMKTELGADTYDFTNYGLTINFVVCKQGSGDIVDTVTIKQGMNQAFPLQFAIKSALEKWETGNYEVMAEITEKSGDKSFKRTTNTFNVNVVSNNAMIEFEDVEPETFNENLGEVNLNTNMTFKFNVNAKCELDNHFTLQKKLFVRCPNSTKYNEVNKDPFSGRFTIVTDEEGYYSVKEVGQIVQSGNVIAQIERECHFTVKNEVYTVTTQKHKESEYNLVGGSIYIADRFGNVRTSFQPGETVYVDVKVNPSTRVTGVQVKKSNGDSVALINDSYFTMPNCPVVVHAYMNEKLRALNYRESNQSDIDQTVMYDYNEGIVLKEATYTKTGYVQTGWKIGNTVYAIGDTFRDHAANSAVPVFSPVTMSSVVYKRKGYPYSAGYTDHINYDYSVDPYYTILDETPMPSSIVEVGEYIRYYELADDYVSVIDGTTHYAGDKFAPNQKIMPFEDGMVLYAVIGDNKVINPIQLINSDYNIGVGDNPMFHVTTAGCQRVEFVNKADPGTSILNGSEKMTIAPNSITTFVLYINASEGYMFPTYASEVDLDLSIVMNRFNRYAFIEEPTFTVTTTGIYPTYSSMAIEITFKSSCGNDLADHDFDEDQPHWCIGDNHMHYTCSTCGLEVEGEVVQRPNDLTIEQEHRLILVPEYVQDCGQGLYSINAHYVCTDCGKWFVRHGIGVGSYYEETTLDECKYLHAWSDYVPRVIPTDDPAYDYVPDQYRGVPVHCCVCMHCGLIDIDTLGFHHNDQDGYGMCDDCAYDIECNHQYSYVEVPSTCSQQGSLTRTCTICGDETVIYFNKADHELVYVEEVPSTCQVHGKGAHYKCIHCGTLFDEDIYVYINEIDPEGMRFAYNLDEVGSEYELTDDLIDLLDAEYDLDENYKYEDQLNPGLYHWDWGYIREHSQAYQNNQSLRKAVDARYIADTVDAYRLAHQIAQPQVLPLDPDNHIHTEIRDAVAPTANADGYSGDVYCSACDTKLEDGHVVAKHVHSYTGDEWKGDDNNHWHVCNAFDGCVEVIDNAAHTYGDWEYVTFPDKISVRTKTCTVCGYMYVEDYEAQPTVVDGVNTYEVKLTDDMLGDVNGVDVKYIFTLAKNNDGAVTLNMNGITVTFNKAAVNEIAGNENIKFKMTTSTEGLNAYNIENAQLIINLSLGGVNFANGKATVSVEVGELPAGSEVKVYYVDGQGNKTDMNATYNNGVITFDTPHFSTYVVAHETPIAPTPSASASATANATATTGTEDSGKGGNAGLIIGIIAGVIVLAAGGFCVYWFVIRKKSAKPANEGKGEKKDEKSDEKKD